MIKKIYSIFLFILIVVFIVFVISFLYKGMKAILGGGSFNPISPGSSLPIKSVNTINNPNISVATIEDIIIKDSELKGLDGTFEKIRQASLDNNISLLNKYYSEKTLRYYASSGGGRIIKTYLKDMEFSNLRKLSSAKVLVTISQIEMSGHIESQNLIFVRETNGWKMGVVETAEYLK